MMKMRWTKWISLLAMLLSLSSCSPLSHRPPQGERDKEALKKLMETYGFDEQTARFYLDHPDLIRRYQKPPAVYRGGNLKVRNYLTAKYLDMFILYREEGNLDKAIEMLLKVKKMNPHSSIIDYNLGVLYQEKGMIREAIRWYEEALDKTYTEEIIQDSQLNLAVCYLKLGQIGKAKLFLKEVEKQAPDDPYVNYNFGVAYLEEGRYDEAIRRFEICLKDEELAPDARMGMGLCCAKMGRRKEALEQFEEVLRMRPNDPQAWYNVGVLRFEMGDFERSKEAFERAEKLGFKGGGIGEFLRAIEGMREREARIAYNEGVSLQRERRYEEAIKRFRRALELDPEMKEAYLNMAYCLSAVGRREEAAEALERALELDDRFFEAYFNLGTLYLEMGRAEEAEGPLSKAVELRPSYAKARYNLGLALYRQGRYEEAAEEFEEAVRLAPKWDEAHYNLGMSYLMGGRAEKAVEEFKTTLKLNPSHDKARKALSSLEGKLRMRR